MDKSKPDKLVNGKATANVWTGNGLSQNGFGGGREGEVERGGSRGFQWLPTEKGPGMVPEMWDKPLWRGVCPYWDPWEGGWTRALHPSRNSESTCLDRSPHDGRGECPSDGDSSPELRDMWKYGCPKSPVWSSGGGEFAGSEGTSSFEDYEHNVDNLALETFPSTWTGYDFWGEGCVGRNGVRMNRVNELACLILRFLSQFEQGVPSSEWWCSFCSFVCLLVLCKVQEVERRPYNLSEALWQKSEGWLRHRNCLWCTPFICWSVWLALVTVVFFLSHEASTQKLLKINRRSGYHEMMTCGSERWTRTEKRWLFCTWCGSKGCAENSRGASDSVHCSVWCNDKFSQFRVFRNCGSSAKCNKPKGWSMTLSRKRKLFFEFSCSLISKKRTNLYTPFFKKYSFLQFLLEKPRASLLKNICSSWFTPFFSSFIDSLFVLWSQWHGHRPRVIRCSKPSHSFSCFFFFSCFHWFLFFFTTVFFSFFSFFIAFFVPFL